MRLRHGFMCMSDRQRQAVVQLLLCVAALSLGKPSL